MIKTYLQASNAALLPQKMLQSWICKARESFILLCEIKFCLFFSPFIFIPPTPFLERRKTKATAFLTKENKKKPTPMLCYVMQQTCLRYELDMPSQVGNCLHCTCRTPLGCVVTWSGTRPSQNRATPTFCCPPSPLKKRRHNTGKLISLKK